MTAHTPVNFLKAGDIGHFSADCIKLLAECGYSPEDFGSHAYVQNEIETAKRRCREYDEHCAGGGDPNAPPPAPQRPGARDRMLSHCTSAHLSKSGLYQHAGGSTGSSRGDSCRNHTPQPGQGGVPGTGGDTRGYHTDLAPTMPVLTGAAGTSQPLPASPAQRMNDEEAAQRRAAIQNAQANGSTRATVDSPTMSANAQTNAGIALSEGRTPADPQHAAVVQGRRAELATVPAPGSVPSAAAAEGDASANAGGGGQEFTGGTAAECVESFRKAAMSRMRQEMQSRHGTQEAHEATQARARERVDEARAAEAAAQQRLNATPRVDENLLRQDEARERKGSLTPAQATRLAQTRATQAARAREQGAVDAARREREGREREVANGECLREQIASLAGSDPPMTGVEPGWPEETQPSQPTPARGGRRRRS